jgi:hypothetical protein
MVIESHQLPSWGSAFHLIGKPRPRQPTETEEILQTVTRILTANPAERLPEERAAGISSIGPVNEPEHECPHCRDSGWRWVDLPGSGGMRQCEYFAENARARYLSLIPERFRDSSFESFKPQDPKQERAISRMRKDPGGSFISPALTATGRHICSTRSTARSCSPEVCAAMCAQLGNLSRNCGVPNSMRVPCRP